MVLEWRSFGPPAVSVIMASTQDIPIYETTLLKYSILLRLKYLILERLKCFPLTFIEHNS